ncbi:hypothetical protein T12_16878 [Trichinella patagoniensis]|uniref:Uncharacterized protein n=1 Tax=Trichinella patagoniensis TaxID=990121 RepID=A0A0V0Z9I6_9BILA|nr:hypothetical protein T12_16878 [Trichinella patagoniensis]
MPANFISCCCDEFYSLSQTQIFTGCHCNACYLSNFDFILCYDGPFWDDARLRHGDATGVLELECRPSTVGGSVGVVIVANLSPERIKRFLKNRP